MKDIRTTNVLLLFIVIPLIFYLLKILSFIFIPLTFSMFIVLLFLPMMRWLSRKKVPKFVGIFIVLLIISGIFKIGGELIQVSIKEILATDATFFTTAETKLVSLIVSIEDFFGIQRALGDNVLLHYLQGNNNLKSFGSTIDFVGDSLTMILLTAFFVVLLLSGSIDNEKILNTILFKQKHTSVKTFIRIERDLIKFIKVKFVISFFTGLGFSLACLFFNVSFPIFWGLFAFVINFVQMVGSVVSVVTLSLFAFIELDPTGFLLFFIITIIAVQVIMGGVLEPIFMGKSFSINVITILVMLMLWGYIWGVAGLILAIPITVFIKIILEQFPNTKMIAELFAGKENVVKHALKKK